jgi:hypothetical protein
VQFINCLLVCKIDKNIPIIAKLDDYRIRIHGARQGAAEELQMLSHPPVRTYGEFYIT